MIGVSEMENETTRKLLAKIFKHIGLEKNIDGEYYRPVGMPSLVAQVKAIIHEEEEEKDRMAQELLGEVVPEEDFKLGGKERKQNRMQLDRLPEVIHKIPTRPRKEEENKPIYGPSRPPVPEKQSIEDRLLQGVVSLSCPNKTDIDDENGRSMLDAFTRSATEYNSGKRNKMRKVIGPSKPGEEEEEEDNEEITQQERLRAYFDDYDRQHRPKSLLELHQERKRAGDMPYKEFDKDDLFTTKIDSKKVFQLMGSASNNLNKRFSSAKYKNSFM